MKKVHLIMIAAIWLSYPAVSQSRTGDDARQDTATVSWYIRQGDSSKFNEERITAYRRALAIATKLEYDRGILLATLEVAEYHVRNNAIDSALHVYKTALPKLEKNDTLLAKLYLHMGADLEKKSSFDSARLFVNKGLSLSQKTHNQSNVARGYVILGNFELNKYNYDSAFAYYAKADSVCEADPQLKISIQHAQVYNYLGYAVRVSHDYGKTEDFYNKAKSMYQTLNHQMGVQEVNIGLAQLYNSQQKYTMAIPLINEAVLYHKDYGTLNSYTYALIVRGYILLQMKRFAEAEKDYKLYYNLVFTSDDKTLQRRATYYMGFFYREKGDYPLGIEYLTKAIALCKEADDNRNLKQSYEVLIDVYKKTKNLEQLSSTYEEYIAFRNEIDKKEKERAIYDLEARYRTKQKEQEIALLTEQNKVTEQQRKSQLFLLLGLLVTALVTGGVLYYAYRNKLRTAAKQRNLDDLRSRFFANVSHEFRTPLTLIKSPLQNLQSQIQSDEAQKQLALISQNANRMLALVDQLLELSRLDSGTLRLLLRQENVSAFLHSIAEPFAYQAQASGIEFSCFIKPSSQLHWIDRDVIEKIFSNLLINAIKYTPPTERIMLKASVAGEQLKIMVANSGVTLKSSEVNSLLERFYQKNNNNPGAGIGLSVVKELVALYKGELAADVKNNTLTFSIALPLNPEFLKDISVLSQESETEGVITAGPADKHEELPLLLIAEDNADVRLILHDIFKTGYRIIETADGGEALKAARREVPDLVISDVMMPGLNGYELTRRLKEDEVTSFIPVVLLTAKSGDDAHLEGLQSQADAFIAKPFNHGILVSKVKLLLDEQRKLRERYSKELILKPKEITLNTVDEKFIERLQRILDTHLANPEFSTDQFAKEAGMSRMQLHRKLKSMLGVSATEFLRNERLTAAAELLKKAGVNISEVAYSVGFNDADYFTQCFKEKYGVTPTTYIKQSRPAGAYS